MLNYPSHQQGDHLVRSFLQDQSGVTAIEYALIASLIAVAIIAAVSTVGTSITGVFTKVASTLG